MTDKNCVLFMVSNLTCFEILVKYFYEDKSEKYDIILLHDDRKFDLVPQITSVLSKYKKNSLLEAKLVPMSDIYAWFTSQLKFSESQQKFWDDYGCSFKFLIYDYAKYLGYNNILSLDDDTFVFKKLDHYFDEKKIFVKKDPFPAYPPSTKSLLYINDYEQFKSIFNIDPGISSMRPYSINAGTVLFRFTEDIPAPLEFVKKVYTNEYFNKNVFLKERKSTERGFGWTIEQRFWVWYFALLQIKYEKDIDRNFPGVNLKITISGENTKSKLTKLPYVIHYPIGSKKSIFLNSFLPRLDKYLSDNS